MTPIAARLERLPPSRVHRRFITLISLGGWFDFYDIFMVAYLAAALRSSGFLDPVQMNLFVSSGFAGMFVGSSLYAGLFTNDQAVFMQRDQYTRGDETQKTDMHDHGVGRHYGDWFVNVGEKYNRVWRCNTWTAPSSEVS